MAVCHPEVNPQFSHAATLLGFSPQAGWIAIEDGVESRVKRVENTVSARDPCHPSIACINHTV